jgi:tyrosyl-tRNA synthetase
LRADGTKFGKTESGAVWLDPTMTSPYAFYQFFVNTPDDQVPTLLRRLTLIAPAEIEELERAAVEAPQERRAQRALAAHLTEMVHGPEGLAEAEAATEQRFSGAAVDDALVIERVSVATWPDLLVVSGIASSKGDARRLIEGGGFYVGDQQIQLEDPIADVLVGDDVVILRKGKKTRVPVRFT